MIFETKPERLLIMAGAWIATIAATPNGVAVRTISISSGLIMWCVMPSI